jgi:hypothetical protein
VRFDSFARIAYSYVSGGLAIAIPHGPCVPNNGDNDLAPKVGSRFAVRRFSKSLARNIRWVGDFSVLGCLAECDVNCAMRNQGRMAHWKRAYTGPKPVPHCFEYSFFELSKRKRSSLLFVQTNFFT